MSLRMTASALVRYDVNRQDKMQTCKLMQESFRSYGMFGSRLASFDYEREMIFAIWSTKSKPVKATPVHKLSQVSTSAMIKDHRPTVYAREATASY